jgi:hypothetical protein
MIARESHCASFRLYCLLSRPKNHALGKDDVSCDFEDGGDTEPLLGSLDRVLGRFVPVRQSAASQTCGTTIAMSTSTGISVPSLRQAAAGGTGNFAPGSGFFSSLLLQPTGMCRQPLLRALPHLFAASRHPILPSSCTFQSQPQIVTVPSVGGVSVCADASCPPLHELLHLDRLASHFRAVSLRCRRREGSSLKSSHPLCCRRAGSDPSCDKWPERMHDSRAVAAIVGALRQSMATVPRD